MENNRASHLLYQDLWHESVTLPCLFLCTIFFLVLGILPLVPDKMAEVLKPIFLVLCLFSRGRGYYKTGYEKWLIILIFYVSITWIINYKISPSIRPYLSMLLFVLFFLFSGLRIWSEKEIRYFFITIVISCSLYAIIILYSNGGLVHSGSNQHISYLSHTINRNSSAFSVTPGAVCAAFLFFYSGKRGAARILFLLSFLLSFFTIIALSCRSAFLSTSAGVLLIVWQAVGINRGAGDKTARRIGIIVLSLFLLWIAMSVLEGTNSDRLFDYSDSGRDDIWKTAVELIREKPVFGGGFEYWERSGQPMSPHNSFLNIMLISGCFGGALLGMLILAMIIECYRQRSIVALAFALEMMFHSISESGLDYFAYIPLILTTVVLRYSEYQRRPFSTVFLYVYRR